MATKTTNFGFTKPDGSDDADIAVLNTNFDLVDAEFKKQKDSGVAQGKTIADAVDTLSRKVDKVDGSTLLSGEDKVRYDGHVEDTKNPHGVNKVQVGLGEADNTADADKPVSKAQQEAIDRETTRAKVAEKANADGIYTLNQALADKLAMVEVWRNDSPGSTFLGHSIAMKLSDYDLVGIAFNLSNTAYGQGAGFFSIVPKGKTNSRYFTYTNGFVNRAVSFADSVASFGSGYNGSDANDNYAIPYKIYGIGGVKS